MIKKFVFYCNDWLLLQAGDLSEFEACFAYACPKFLSPVPPALDDKKDQHDALHKEPLRWVYIFQRNCSTGGGYFKDIRQFRKLALINLN